MTTENLQDIAVELKRFQKKLAEALIEAEKNNLKTEVWNKSKNKTAPVYSNKASAAVKRAAMDLKHELTKIT
jgi:hypothetical protein